jgi:flavin reductase (DIM6/NTAB) family NADH-FMN oxidoreductase RutF
MTARGADAFDGLVAVLDYPMFVVTVRAGEHRAGCLVGFASQASIRPPRFLVGISQRNYTFRIAQDATHLAVHVLSRRHVALAELFGSQTGDQVDKFSQCAWHSGPFGVPILDDAAAWFVGEVIDRFAFGDHVGHLLEPVDGHSPGQLRQWVTFADVRDVTPGHQA